MKTLLLLALLLASSGLRAACENPSPLRLALIPKSNPQQLRQTMAPLVRALEQALKRRVELGVSHSYGAVVEGLLGGAVDLAELGPASYALLMQRDAVAQPVAALSARSAPGAGIASYHSVLITRADAGFDQIDKLRQRSVSLTDPASTSGALLPRQALPQLTGQPLESFFGQVSYAGSHDRAIAAVRRRLVDAAFVSSTRLEEAMDRQLVGADEFRVLWRSHPLPGDPFVLRNALCPELRALVRQTLLAQRPDFAPMFEGLNAGPFVAATAQDYQGVLGLFDRERAGGVPVR